LAELDFDHEQNEVHEEYIQVQRSTTTGNYDFDSDGRIHYDNELHMNGQGVHEEVVQVKQAVRTGYSGNPYYAAELQMQPDFHGNGDVFADDGYRPDIIASTENIVSSQQQQQQQQQQLSVSEQPDVKLRHGEQRHSSRKGRSSSRRKSSGSETETMASKLQKLLGTMEDAFPTALGVDDIVRITKIKRSDVETLLVELSQAKSIVEVENGLWIRAQVQRSAAVRLSKRSSKTPQDPAARQHEFRMVGHLPVLPPKEQPTIAIITSLYCEKLAVDAVMDYKTTYIRCKKGGEGQVYTIGKIGKHRVVSTKLSRIGRDAGATTATGNTVTRLLGAFGKVEHVLLVGVAGGVAYCDDDSRHVRLGDVVISRPVRPGAPVYLQLTEADDDPRAGWDAGAIVRNWSPTDATLTGIAERLQRSKNFYKHIDQYIKQGLAELEACDTTDGPESASSRDFLSSFRRPPPDTDPRPYIVGSKSKSGEVPPPEHPVVQPGSVRDQRGADRPVAHFGAIAAGRSLTRDAAARRRVADVDGVRAVDVGFQAVFESIDGNRKDSYAVVRGVCDYLDGTSSETQQQRGGGSREWKQYSSLVAAAAAKCLVLGIVAASDDDDDDDD
jgi:nucleoside phosphorylase